MVVTFEDKYVESTKQVAILPRNRRFVKPSVVSWGI
jgi:hypothetical protein